MARLTTKQVTGYKPKQQRSGGKDARHDQKVPNKIVGSLHAVATPVAPVGQMRMILNVVELLAQYSKHALHKMSQFEAIATALESQTADTKPSQSAVAPTAARQRYRLADRLGSETLDKLVARYEAGEPTTALAAEYGVAKSSLLRLLNGRGIAMRQQSLTVEQKTRMRQLRGQGGAIRTIADEVGCSYGTAQAFFKTKSDLSRR